MTKLTDRLERKRSLAQLPAAAGRAAAETGDEPDEGNYSGTIERMAQGRRVSVQHSPGSPSRWLASPERESDQDEDRQAAIRSMTRERATGSNLYRYLKG